MRTDGVVIGTLIQCCGEPTYLEYECPDCGSLGGIVDYDGPWRINCAKTGRVYLVVGIAIRKAKLGTSILSNSAYNSEPQSRRCTWRRCSSTASMLSEIAARRAEACYRVKWTLI